MFARCDAAGALLEQQGKVEIRYRQGDAAEKSKDTLHGRPAPPRGARDDPSVVGQADGPGRPAAPIQPAAHLAPWRRHRAPGSGHSPKVRVEQGQVQLQALVQALHGLLLGIVACRGRRQQLRLGEAPAQPVDGQHAA